MAKRRTSRRRRSGSIGSSLVILAGLAFLTEPQVRWYIIGVLGFVLFVYLFIKWFFKQRLRRSGIQEIDKMPGKQFEEYLADLFQRRGYKVRLTRETGDFGADLILEKDGERTVVQAKRYNKSVGIKAVQEAFSAIPHYKAESAWVVSNSEFTKAAIELATSNNVKLIGRDDLISLVLNTK